MSHYTVTLPSGVEWTPQFIAAINHEKCIGCGRCFKTCARDVLQLMGINDEGELVAVDIDDEDDDDEYERKVMSIAHPENCVGCESCNNNCAKRLISYAPKAV